jgi:hypothetical protein
MIASVGGLVLIGLGVLVRELQRIERALAARPMPRAPRPAEAPAALPGAERSSASGRIPFPPRPKPGAIGPAPPEEAPVPRPRDRFPRLETAPAAEGTDVSLLPRGFARAEDDVGEVKNVAAGGAGGGGPARIAARLNANPRPSAPVPRERPRGSVFDAFWPKGQRGRRENQTAPSPQPSASAEPGSGEAAPEPHPSPGELCAPVTVLKSGTVEGMAYTLYSDGSIEAQLPQGMVRFGSITELRNHIESES